MSASIYRTTVLPAFTLDRQQAIARWTPQLTRRVLDSFFEDGPLAATATRLKADFDGRPIELFDLRGIDLEGSDLQGVDLSYCAFDFANLARANLSRCRFQYSRLRCANLSEATLEGVQASPVDAQEANFSNASVTACFFMHSNLQGVDFSNALLNGSQFAGADLSDLNISGATGADILQIIPHLKGRQTRVALSAEPDRMLRRAGLPKGLPHAVIATANKPDLYGAIKRSIADLTRATSVTIYRDAVVIGKVVPSGDPWARVSVATAKAKPASGKVVLKNRIYKTKSAANWFSVGDTVEIVAYKAQPDRAGTGGFTSARTLYADSAVAFGKPKTKAKQWLVTKLIDTSA